MLNLHQPRFTTTDRYLLSRVSNAILFRSRKKKKKKKNIFPIQNNFTSDIITLN